MAHYLQVTEEDFSKAVSVPTSGEMGGWFGLVNDGSKNGSFEAKVTYFSSHRGSSQVFANVQQLFENTNVMENLAVIAGELEKDKMTSLGLEQLLFWAEILKKLLKMSQKTTRKKR